MGERDDRGVIGFGSEGTPSLPRLHDSGSGDWGRRRLVCGSDREEITVSGSTLVYPDPRTPDPDYPRPVPTRRGRVARTRPVEQEPPTPGSFLTTPNRVSDHTDTDWCRTLRGRFWSPCGAGGEAGGTQSVDSQCHTTLFPAVRRFPVRKPGRGVVPSMNTAPNTSRLPETGPVDGPRPRVRGVPDRTT